MKSILMCGVIIFLKTFMLNFPCAASGKLSVSSRLAHAVCEQRDEYSASKQIAPPLKNVPPSSPDLTCGWFTLDKCPDCSVNFWTCAQAGKGNGKAKGARRAGKFRSVDVGSKIDPSLLADLKERGGAATTTLIISMEGGNEKALRSARSTSSKTRGDRLNALFQSLNNLATTSQKPVLDQIENAKERLSSLSASTLWITNQVVVENADLALAEELAKIPEVSKITKNVIIQYSGNTLTDESLPESELELEQEGNQASEKKKRRRKRQAEAMKHEGWNMEDLQPQAIWKENITGKGIVVGVVGMGARGSHKGLRDNFRSDHGWFDVYGSPTPVEATPNGFGTQNLGPIVSPLNNLGVAPGAQWIACKPFLKTEAYYNDVIRCCQWMLCPTDPSGGNQDCKKAPKIVHGTFNVNYGPSDFQGVVTAWRTANIIPVFGAGNVPDHQACSTIMTPADYDTLISVGALIKDDNGVIRRGDSTGKGPTRSGKLKPDMLAPGNWISSLGHNSDEELAPVGGTNPAGGQVAGLIALLLQANKDLTYSNVYEILTMSALPLNKSMGGNCGGISEDKYPNHYTGYGKVNVVSAFKYLREKFNKPPPTTAAPTTTTTFRPGPSLPPPKFTCYVQDDCRKGQEPKVVESPYPECVIAYFENKTNLHGQNETQGTCDAGAAKCDYCFISKCNKPDKYCNKTNTAFRRAGRSVASQNVLVGDGQNMLNIFQYIPHFIKSFFI